MKVLWIYIDVRKGDYVEKQQSCFVSGPLKCRSDRKLLDPTTYILLVNQEIPTKYSTIETCRKAMVWKTTKYRHETKVLVGRKQTVD